MQKRALEIPEMRSVLQDKCIFRDQFQIFVVCVCVCVCVQAVRSIAEDSSVSVEQALEILAKAKGVKNVPRCECVPVV